MGCICQEKNARPRPAATPRPWVARLEWCPATGRRLERPMPAGAVSGMPAQCGCDYGILPCNGLEESGVATITGFVTVGFFCRPASPLFCRVQLLPIDTLASRFQIRLRLSRSRVVVCSSLMDGKNELHFGDTGSSLVIRLTSPRI